mmetsp:Transcript_3828/g.6774  ORF Transcript_3828/g.6774 Transcript_3828/m.6774 type:complete len:114 (-) Transcript_3828:1284-1625(-)
MIRLLFWRMLLSIPRLRKESSSDSNIYLKGMIKGGLSIHSTISSIGHESGVQHPWGLQSKNIIHDTCSAVLGALMSTLCNRGKGRAPSVIVVNNNRYLWHNNRTSTINKGDKQ